MTDNGSCYRSSAFRKACRDHGLKHVRTRPYTPKTNGKAERFIQTALREWAYARAYPDAGHQAAELPIWLHRYNWHRPHGSLESTPAHQSPRPHREQPVEAPQLEGDEAEDILAEAIVAEPGDMSVDVPLLWRSL